MATKMKSLPPPSQLINCKNQIYNFLGSSTPGNGLDILWIECLKASKQMENRRQMHSAFRVSLFSTISGRGLPAVRRNRTRRNISMTSMHPRHRSNLWINSITLRGVDQGLISSIKDTMALTTTWCSITEERISNVLRQGTKTLLKI